VTMQLLPDADPPVLDADPAVTHVPVVCGDRFDAGYGDRFKVDLAAAVAPRLARVGGSLDPIALGTDPTVSRADLAAVATAVRAGAVGPCCLDDSDSCSPGSSSEGGALSRCLFSWALTAPPNTVGSARIDRGDSADLPSRWWPGPWRGAALLQPSCGVVGDPVYPSVPLLVPLVQSGGVGSGLGVLCGWA
jgi:hypothetical protein